MKVDADFSKLNEKLFKVKAKFDELVIDLGGAIASGIEDMASSIGDAIGSGENVFNAIGDSLTKTIASLAKTIGKQMIAFGTAGIALKNMTKNPYLSVAAGAALVALGSAAQSSVSKTLNGGGGGYSYKPSSLTKTDYRPSTINIRVTGEIRNDTIKLSNDRGNRDFDRYFGR